MLSKKIFIGIVLCSIFFISCSSQGANIREEWPENYDEIVAVREEVKENLQENIIEYEEIREEISLVKETPRHIMVNKNPATVELLGITDKNKTRLSINGFAYLLETNATFRRENISFQVLEISPNSVITPRKSWVSFTVNNQPHRSFVGQTQTYVGLNISVPYIYEEEELTAYIIIDNEEYFLSRSDEILIQDIPFRIQDIRFFNASEFQKLDGVTIRVN